jgi:adenosylcobinamide-phosphate synthase
VNAVPALAVLLDRVAGEPPAHLHPVVWMGRYCTWASARTARATGTRQQVMAGIVAVAGGTVASALAGVVVRRAVARLPRPLAVVTEAAALSTLLSAALLEREVLRVRAALDGGSGDALAAGRRIVAGLVSRDVSALDTVQVREAALESLSENAADAIVAPLWWFAAGGLPAAAAYRFVNTADAMWGYRDGSWEWRGKGAALADDLANWWPARLTALLLAPRAGVGRLARTAGATASPNAGWPMGALALRLDVRLGKPGVYTLHPGGRAPQPDDVGPAVQAVRRATAAATAAATLIARSAP